jgi:hypothetical protein
LDEGPCAIVNSPVCNEQLRPTFDSIADSIDLNKATARWPLFFFSVIFDVTIR